MADDYQSIRSAAGVWDYSDLVKVRVSGDGARDALDGVLAGNVQNLQENAIRHTLMLGDDGAILADVMLHATFDDYVVTCAPGRRDQVVAVLESIAGEGVLIEDITAEYAVWVVEGPLAWQVARDLFGIEATGVRLLGFLEGDIDGNPALLVRIGSSGEYGYMFWVPPDAADSVLAKVRELCPQAEACDRDVQDVLKLEVRAFNLPRDLVDGESPLEAGLHWMIDFHKDAFTGRDALLEERAAGVARKLVAFEVVGDGSTERSSAVRDGGETIGYVANAAFSPTLGRTIGLAYLTSDYAWVGLELDVDTDQGAQRLRTVSAPFFMTESNKAPMG